VALATYYGSHICVDALWEHLQPPGRRRLDILATLLTLAFLVPLAWMVWVKVAGTGTQGTMDLRMPLWVFYSIASVGTSVAVLLAVVRIVFLWRGQDDKLKPEPLALG
jgi:TRAP-type C4-dicarboxylate transport system permease small subunit